MWRSDCDSNGQLKETLSIAVRGVLRIAILFAAAVLVADTEKVVVAGWVAV